MPDSEKKKFLHFPYHRRRIGIISKKTRTAHWANATSYLYGPIVGGHVRNRQFVFYFIFFPLQYKSSNDLDTPPNPLPITGFKIPRLYIDSRPISNS